MLKLTKRPLPLGAPACRLRAGAAVHGRRCDDHHLRHAPVCGARDHQGEWQHCGGQAWRRCLPSHRSLTQYAPLSSTMLQGGPARYGPQCDLWSAGEGQYEWEHNACRPNRPMLSHNPCLCKPGAGACRQAEAHAWQGSRQDEQPLGGRQLTCRTNFCHHLCQASSCSSCWAATHRFTTRASRGCLRRSGACCGQG